MHALGLAVKTCLWWQDALFWTIIVRTVLLCAVFRSVHRKVPFAHCSNTTHAPLMLPTLETVIRICQLPLTLMNLANPFVWKSRAGRLLNLVPKPVVVLAGNTVLGEKKLTKRVFSLIVTKL